MEFMDGVTLIKECTELSDKGVKIMIAVGLATIVLFAAALWGGFAWSSNPYHSKTGSVIGCFFSMVILVAASFVIQNIIPQNFQKTNGEYEVVIDGNVDMNEFCKRYEIIDFEDGKYIIKFKEE